MKRMHGFTLLEMLAAISLLGLLLVLAAGSFASSGATLERSSAWAERLEQVRAAQRFVRQSVQSMQPAPWFSGESASLVYLAAVPLGLDGKPRRQRLEFVPTAPGEWGLQVSFFDLNSGQPWGDRQMLFDRLREGHLEYRGLDDLRRDSGWLRQWPWPQRLPRQVRVQAQAIGSVQWATLSIAIRIHQQTGVGP